MLVAMLLSIGFIILDICSVTSALKSALPDGLNPFWKLAFVFKCLTDSVILDDFKTALDRLRAYKINKFENFAIDTNDHHARGNRALESAWTDIAAPNGVPATASPDGDYLHHSQEPHWPEGKDVDHVERQNPSRDRDSEDHEAVAVGNHELRILGGSDARGLRSPTTGGRESSGSEQYAKAMREVANDSPRDGREHHVEKHIDVAR
jgi:hypothetical protein